MTLTKSQRRALELIRDTGRPYAGDYRHNIKQWEMWEGLRKAGLTKRLAYPRRYRITKKGLSALQAAR